MRALLIALLLFPAPLAAQSGARPEDAITMSGEGVVQVVPDRAWITVGAESRAGSARDAQNRNTEAMTPVLAKLKSAGIPAEAIRTVAYDVQYEWDFVNNRRVGRGYVARNTVEVRVDAVDRLGELLEAAVGSGATTLGGIRFDLKDRNAHEREAVRQAVLNARAKAETAAGVTGRAVDRVIRVDEQGIASPPVPLRMMREVAAVAADGGAPISSGQIEIKANVTVTVALK
jgi:uncharacterized protein YggE